MDFFIMMHQAIKVTDEDNKNVDTYKNLADIGKLEVSGLFKLGVILATKFKATEEELRQAFNYFTSALAKSKTDQEKSTAHYLMGVCLAEGKGVNQNKAAAFTQFMQSMRLNPANVDAWNALKHCFEEGIGITANPAKAELCKHNSYSNIKVSVPDLYDAPKPVYPWSNQREHQQQSTSTVRQHPYSNTSSMVPFPDLPSTFARSATSATTQSFSQTGGLTASRFNSAASSATTQTSIIPVARSVTTPMFNNQSSRATGSLGSIGSDSQASRDASLALLASMSSDRRSQFNEQITADLMTKMMFGKKY